MKGIFDFLISSKKLPTMPAVAAQLLELSTVDGLAPRDVVSTIEKDPAIAAKLLRVANLPMYGFSSQVGDITQAIARVGMDETMRTAMMFSVATLMDKQQTSSLDLEHQWMRSLIAASSVFGITPDRDLQKIAYLSALLQDIGIFIWDRVDPRYAKLVADSQYEHAALWETEHELFAFGHNEISAWILNRWRLPSQIVAPIMTTAHDGRQLDSVNAIVFLSSLVAEAFTTDDPTYRDSMVQEVAGYAAKMGIEVASLMTTTARAMNTFADIFASDRLKSLLDANKQFLPITATE